MFLQETMFEATEALIDYAESKNRIILELGLSWLADLPEIPSVIAGATTPEQVTANIAACSWTLTEEERVAIEKLRPI